MDGSPTPADLSASSSDQSHQESEHEMEATHKMEAPLAVPAPVEASSVLSSHLLDALYSGRFSDLQILDANGFEYRVHKAVLCNQSIAFDKMCTTGLKESETGIIDLADYDPPLVKALVQYLYTSDYRAPLYGPIEELFGCGNDDKTQDAVREKLFAYTQNIVFHVRLYALATYFEVPGHHCAVRFIDSSHNFLIGFLDAVEITYSSTPSEDRIMRDAVVVVAVKNHQQLSAPSSQAGGGGEDFSKLLDKCEGFREDLSVELGKALLKDHQPSQDDKTNFGLMCSSCSAGPDAKDLGALPLRPQDLLTTCDFCKKEML